MMADLRRVFPLDQYPHARNLLLFPVGDRLICSEDHRDDIFPCVSENLRQPSTVLVLLDGLDGDHPEDIVRIYGSPWQPEFFNWAYNLPRNGEELKAKWDAIPDNTDILVTHGPAWGFLDDVEGRRGDHLGCELLAERIKAIKPKIHVCGHIHSGYGHYYDGHTHYFNASVLNERYNYAHEPWHFEWDNITNEITWLKVA